MESTATLMPGDMVKVLHTDYIHDHKVGAVYRVNDVSETGDGAYIDDLFYFANELELVAKAGEYAKALQEKIAPDTSLQVQVGGNHYKKHSIQPIEYIFENNLGFCEGNVIKYVTRYKDKGGVKDLEKAKHYLELLIESIQKDKNDA
jgi:hypothetical protein